MAEGSTPNQDGYRLCPNPKCNNSEVTKFLEKHTCGNDESMTLIVCSECGEELPKDEWMAFLPSESLHNSIPSDVDIPQLTRSAEEHSRSHSTEEVLIYDVQQSSSTSVKPKLKHSMSLTEQLAQAGSLAGDDVRCRESASEMFGDFNHSSFSELIGSTPCRNCKSVLFPVRTDLDETLVWHCQICNTYEGVDDTFGIQETMKLANLLMDSLEKATLKTPICPGLNGSCTNDDPMMFIFDYDNWNRLLLRCVICQHEQVIDDVGDTELPVTPTAGDVPYDGIDEGVIIQCDCGNDHPEAFEVRYHQCGLPVKVLCHVCDAELILDRTLVDSEELVSGPTGEQLLFDPPIGRTEVKVITQLAPGDHIAWHQTLAYWHHAVVVKVGTLSGKLKVIHYNGPAKEYGGKGVIMEEWIDVNLCKEALYRMDYTESLPSEEVIGRARERLGEAKYNLFGNNCEHFAQWCKTGVENSDQVKHFQQTVLQIKDRILAYSSKHGVRQGIKAVKQVAKIASKYKTATGSLSASAKGFGQVTSTATAGGAPKALVKASADVAKKEATEAGKAIGGLDYAAVGLVLVIEGYRTGNDIHKMYKKKQKGHISKEEFVRFTVKRTSQGVGGAAGTIIGGSIGQACIPIPVVGSIVGATLGAYLGEGLGLLLGRKLINKK